MLYFENASADSADAVLAEGITEDLIARLSQVNGLRVTSRYGSLRYRGRPAVDPRLVSRELGARYVLQGKLRRTGQSLRIIVEITDASRGYNVWGQTYERPVRDVFSLEDSVAVQVAEAVRGRITGQERARLVPAAPRTSSEAYQALLSARTAIRHRTAAAAARAVAAYLRAIALDSSLAAAYAGLAHTYSVAVDWGWDIPGIPRRDLVRLAMRAAGQALALDSLNADTWLASAMAWRHEDPTRALEHDRRAVGFDSTNIEALHQLAWGFLGVGKLDNAIVIEQRVTTRDPFYAYPYAGLAEMLNVAGRPVEALAAAAQGLAIDSTLGALHLQRADASLRLGRLRDARAAARQALEFGGRPPSAARTMAALARVQEGDSAGGRAELAAVTQELLRAPENLSYFEGGFVAGGFAQLGQTDSAIAWLGRVSVGQRRWKALFFQRHWFFEPVRNDPRFQAFLAEARPR